MNYLDWRSYVFGMPEGSDPVLNDMPQEGYEIHNNTLLDFLDRAFQDPEIHLLFSKEQIGIGLNIIFSNCCSDYFEAYLQFDQEGRIIQAINSLNYLYKNFFEVYCLASVKSIGDCTDGRIGFICYMFWDIFALYPESKGITQKIIDTAINHMTHQLYSSNDNVICSAIHGLGEWNPYCKQTSNIIMNWLEKPTTSNPVVLEYAAMAQTGCIQ